MMGLEVEAVALEQKELYKILNMIDYGSFGDIYKVKCSTDNKIYALKQIHFRGNVKDDPYIVNELHCLTLLKHKNIIQMHELMIDKCEIGIIMEYAENENLERHLFANKDMECHIKYKIYSQVLHAVEYCHSMDIAHRDLTPANILLTKDLVVKIADFGLSVKCFTDEGDPLLCRDYLGHSSYLPPEVLSHIPFLPKPADIWSLGIVLLYMLFHCVPYKGLEEEILERQLNHLSLKCFIDEQSETSSQELKDDVMQFVHDVLQVESVKRSDICDCVRKWDNICPDSLLHKL